MAKKERKGMVGLGCDIHEDIAELLDNLSDKHTERASPWRKRENHR